MPGAFGVLANTGTALCACQDEGSKQNYPLESRLSFHFEGQHSPVSDTKTVKSLVLKLHTHQHIRFFFLLDMHTHMHKLNNADDTQTNTHGHRQTDLKEIVIVYHHQSFVIGKRVQHQVSETSAALV